MDMMEKSKAGNPKNNEFRLIINLKNHPTTHKENKRAQSTTRKKSNHVLHGRESILSKCPLVKKQE